MKQLKVGLYVLFAKVGPKFFTVFSKLLKSTKVVKVGLATGSAVSYAYLLSWQFAVVIMTAIFVHEYGHIWAMKRVGIKTKGIYFIPFMGAAAVADSSLSTTRWTEVFVSLMGPIFGLALILPAYFIFHFTDSKFFLAVISWIILITLFNLLPINPLDGGRIIKSCIFSIHSRLGLIAMAIMFIACTYFLHKTHNGLFIFLGVIAALEFLGEWFRSFNEDEICTTAILSESFKRSYPADFDKNDDIYLNGKKMFKFKKYDRYRSRYADLKFEHELKKEKPNNKTLAVHSREIIRQDIEVTMKRRLIVEDIILFTVKAKNFKFIIEEVPKMSMKRTLITVAIYNLSIAFLWYVLKSINIPEADIAKELMK